MMRRVMIMLFALALSSALVWLLATYDFSRLWQLRGSVIALLVVLSLVYSFLYGVGVTLILRSVGLRRGAWRVFLVISGGGTASYLGNVQLGIPLRLFLFNKLLAIPYAQGAASVALETACWFGLMGVGLLVSGTLANFAPWVAALALAAAAAFAYFLALPLTRRVLAKLPSSIRGVSLRGAKSLLEDLVGALADVRWGWLAAGLIVFSVNYAIDALTVSLVVSNYGEHVGIWDALESVILSYLAGLVTMVPMGIGVRDVSMVALLNRAGVSTDVATTVALVQRSLRTVIPLVIGLVAVNLLGIRAMLAKAVRLQSPGAAESPGDLRQ